ncbi:MAG: hypothetical protein M1352_02605 [Patescibacteria group bacterium]|nr:hypothetical protein [Patescibacteria group bacterium]
MYEDINEPIEVATHFKGGRASPLAFRWQHLFFKVSRVNLYHKFRIGRDVIHAYSVSTDQGGTFKISFDPNLLTWRLNQIYN